MVAGRAVSLAFNIVTLGSLLVLADDSRRQYYQPYEDTPANYHFKWEVKDDYSGQDFGQEEARSGYNTDGEYTVVLPDGRKQIVTYNVADAESGFVADVRYEGDAAPYAEPRPVRPRPTYGPQLRPEPARPEQSSRAYPRRPTYVPKPRVYGPVSRPKATPSPRPYRPDPAPTPAYRPDPAPTADYRPAPSYRARTPTPRPYRPIVPRTYGPVTRPPTTTEAPKLPQPTPDPYRALVRKPISAYKQASQKAVDNKVDDAPIYDSNVVKRRRMKYANRLSAAASNSNESLFYGNVKGRVKAPKRDAGKKEN